MEGGDWEVQILTRYLATLGMQETWEVSAGRVLERNGMLRAPCREGFGPGVGAGLSGCSGFGPARGRVFSWRG